MKPYLIAVKAFILLSPFYALSQTLTKCSDGNVFWLIPDENSAHYAVKLRGDIDLSAQPDILNIDDKALQYILLDSRQYIEQGKDNSDKEILNRYVDGEAAYLRERFGENLEIYSELQTTPEGKAFILWRYLLPHGSNKEVTSLVFADIVMDTEIFGLGSPQFADMELTPIKNLLINAISTVFKTSGTESLCK